MQSIRQCVKYLAPYGTAANLIPACISPRSFHLSSELYKKSLSNYEAPTHFLDYNKTIFPPQKPDEEKRPAVSCAYMLH